MLDELLKYDSLGTKDEILFLLFQTPLFSEQSKKNLKIFCGTKMYSMNRSFDGIIALLEFINFTKCKNCKITFNRKIFDIEKYKEDYSSYFNKPHFFEQLFKTLQENNETELIFNRKNVLYNDIDNHYFFKSNLIPIQATPLINMLLSLGLIKQSQFDLSHLIVIKKFNSLIQDFILTQLNGNLKKRRKISIDQLKKNIELKEEIGREAELFVLEYELKKWCNHPFVSKINIIVEEFANAGYDIESFSGIDFVIPNRFIEVKSYNKIPTFYWSRNEVNTAKELKDEYYLYLVDRDKMLNESYKPLIIKNPYKHIFEDDIWKKETENWKVTLDEL